MLLIRNVSGSFYRYLRLKSNLTQTELESRTGIKQSNIAKMENDYVKVLSSLSSLLLNFYGISANNMLEVIKSKEYEDFILEENCNKIYSNINKLLTEIKDENSLEKLKLLESYINLLNKV